MILGGKGGGCDSGGVGGICGKYGRVITNIITYNGNKESRVTPYRWFTPKGVSRQWRKLGRDDGALEYNTCDTYPRGIKDHLYTFIFIFHVNMEIDYFGVNLETLIVHHPYGNSGGTGPAMMRPRAGDYWCSMGEIRIGEEFPVGA